MKVKLFRSMENNVFIYRVKLKKWFFWIIQYEDKDREKAEDVYRELLRSTNVEKG